MRPRFAIMAATGLYAGIIGMPMLLSAQTLVLDPKTGKITHEAADPNAMPADAGHENSAEMKAALQKAQDVGLTPDAQVGADGAALQADTTVNQDTRIGLQPSMAVTTITRSATSGEAAKSQAYMIAKRDGLRKILQMQAPDRTDALMQLLDDKKIEGMVAGVDAMREDGSASLYQGTLNVRFDAKKLEALLGQKLKKEAPKVEELPGLRGEASLVIPVWQEGDHVKIWEPENAWRKALNRAALQESRGKLVMPYGDPMDQLAVTNIKLPSLTFAELAHLTSRYGTADVVIVQASPVAGNGLNLTLTHMDAKNTSQQQQLITVPPGQSREALLASAASYVAQAARQQFQSAREAEVTKEEAVHRIRALAPITRASDWASMRSRLSAMPMIDSLTPVDIAPEQVEMELVFRGTPEAFGNALKAANIHVSPQGNKLLLGFYPVGN